MIGNLKNHISDQIELVKLEGVEAIGKIAARLIFLLIMMLFAMFFIMLLSFAGAFYLGELYGKVNGFLMVTGIYFLLIILFILFKKPFQDMIMNIAIAASMKNND